MSRRRDTVPFHLNAAIDRATALQAAGEARPAADLWRQVARAAPGIAGAQFNLGATLLACSEFKGAEAAFRAAIRLKPDFADAHHRLGNVLQATGRWGKTGPCYQEALRLQPDLWRARLDLAHLHLGLGDFERGWPLFEARRSLSEDHIRPPALDGEWQGDDVAGKRVLVWPEQGFGDQMMFARFVPQLAARGAEVTLLAPPELARLFEASFADVTVVVHADGAHIEAPDRWTMLASLPLHLGVTLPTLPAGPYLTAPAAARERWRGFAEPGSVGVVWQGRATPNPHRSLPSRDVLKPLEDAGARLVDIVPPDGGDFADTAAMIEQLDLVVTVDTAVAHLASALGKPVWILTPWLNSDWRWMQKRRDCPWYASARLFRQPAHGDWDSVIAEVVSAWRER